MSVQGIGVFAQRGSTRDEPSDPTLDTILTARGWQRLEWGRAWAWPHPVEPGDAGGPDWFASGAWVLLDRDGPGYLVELPARQDRPGPRMRCRTRRDLLRLLPVIE